MREFNGRVAVVTGSGSGIGEALAWRFARAGMKIVVADIDAAAAERVRAALERDGHQAIVAVTNVADAASVEQLADSAYARYGSERNRPDELRPLGGPASETPELQAIAANLYANALSPETVAEQTFEAVRENRLYQFTTTRFDDAIRDRAEAILARRNPEFSD